jgi:hypothetical protein
LEDIMLGRRLFAAMVGMVGFVLWDRRTALAPAIRESRELHEKMSQEQTRPLYR